MTNHFLAIPTIVSNKRRAEVTMDSSQIFGEPLDAASCEIRLLLMQSGTGDELIKCTMLRASLEEAARSAVRFNALSYVWGDLTDTRTISINGKFIAVTKNLESALRRLLERGEAGFGSFPLWVDAVCINQEDMQERNQQVNIMADIYQQAERVIVWLGEGDNYTDWSLERLHDPKFWRTLEETPSGPTSEYSYEITYVGLVMVRNLARRQYWTRVWIIQELMLARNDPVLLCGSHSIPWSHFVLAQKHLPDPGCEISILPEERGRYRESDLASIPEHSDTYRISSHPRGGLFTVRALVWDGLRTLIQSTGHISYPKAFGTYFFRNNASEPRDYVYGFRGLISQEERKQIEVDYTIPFMRLCHDAMALLWASPDTESIASVITLLSFHRQTVDHVPSWVPDLSRQKEDDVAGYHGQFVTRQRNHETSWRPPLSVELSEDRKTLKLRGVRFDSVVRHYQLGFRRDKFADEPSDLVVIPADLKRAELEFLASQRSPIPPSNPLHALSEFKMQGDPLVKMVETFSSIGSEFTEAEFTEAEKNLSLTAWGIIRDGSAFGPKIPVSSQESRKLKILLAAMKRTMWQKLYHRSIVETEAGFIGIGPKNLEIGDIVVFVFGMANPLILRPDSIAASEPESYSIVGFAYFHDLMDFERLNELYKQGLLDEMDICIR
jgi:hypothetical protein